MERDSLSRIEIGTRFVTDYELKVLAKVLGVSLFGFLTMKTNEAAGISRRFCYFSQLFFEKLLTLYGKCRIIKSQAREAE